MADNNILNLTEPTEVFGPNFENDHSRLVKDQQKKEKCVSRRVNLEISPNIRNQILRHQDIAGMLQDFFYIINILSAVELDGWFRILYECYDCTLSHLIKNENIAINGTRLKSIILSILKGLEMLHMNNMSYNNASPDSIAICVTSDGVFAKLLHLSGVRMHSKVRDFLDDLKGLAKIILMIVTKQDSVERVFQALVNESKEQKLQHILELLQDFKWIEEAEYRSFAEFIATLIGVDCYGRRTISNLMCHNFLVNTA